MCKIKTRIYPYILVILSEVILIGCSITIIALYKSRDLEELIWMGSKKFTIEKLMKINNNESFPILNIYRDGTTENYSENYASLLAHSGKECEKNYKKCGILDSLGNILCIPENKTCPLNELKVDLASKNDSYISMGYK